MNEMTERQKAACNETRADEFSGTDADARDCFIYGRWVSGDPERHGAEFDEWLARHDAAVRVEAGAAALEAAADVLSERIIVPVGIIQQMQAVYDMGPKLQVNPPVWLRARAASLRSALEGERTEPKLDPQPWVGPGQSRHSSKTHFDPESDPRLCRFLPRPGFSQDPAHYPGGTR